MSTSADENESQRESDEAEAESPLLANESGREIENEDAHDSNEDLVNAKSKPCGSPLFLPFLSPLFIALCCGAPMLLSTFVGENEDKEINEPPECMCSTNMWCIFG